MKPSLSSLTLIISLIFFLFSCKPHPEQQRPNILFIMSDDHAFQAISAYGSGLNATPNIDEMRFPGKINQGIDSDHLVLNLDIAPTLLKAVSVNIPDDMQGKALQPTWTNSTESWRDAIYYHYYEKSFGATPHYGIRTSRYKLIHFYDVVDSWELYDLIEDPQEMNNMYYDPDYKEVVVELKLKLEGLKEKYKDD